MNELNSGLALRIHLPGREAHSLQHYLPDAFGPKDTEIKTLLMDEQDHGFPLSGDALTQAAIQAANRCHAPYSNSPSGVALELKDGTIFCGSYAENAAFNPTLPPLQGALNLLSLNGYDYPDIQRALLAESRCIAYPVGCDRRDPESVGLSEYRPRAVRLISLIA